MAEDKDEAESAFILACECENTLKDYNKAKYWYEKAVALGHPQGQFNYALWFLEGTRPGTPMNLVRARELFELASAQGMGIALLNLGQFYEKGYGGVCKDLAKAYKLYKRASKDPSKNWPNNKFTVFLKLSQMTHEGKGTKPNSAKANKYMKKAKTLRDDNVPDKVTKLMNMMQTLDLEIEQDELDINWTRCANYVDHLPPEEKPDTFGKWVTILGKFGYQVRFAGVAKEKKCDFDEFVTLSDGSVTMFADYKMKNQPVPARKCITCGVQESETVTMKKCSRCKEIYCSRTCQKKDWPEHKKICNTIAAEKRGHK